MERGLRSTPDPDTAERLAGALRLVDVERDRFKAAARSRAAAIHTAHAVNPAPADADAEPKSPIGSLAIGTPPSPGNIQILGVPLGLRLRKTQRRGAWVVVICAFVLAVATAAAARGPTGPFPVSGGTWTDALPGDPTSLIPNGGGSSSAMRRARYAQEPLLKSLHWTMEG
jgi:hypothetical protein